jgi:adenylate cyclase
MVQLENDLKVVGIPVVYASRMSAAPAGNVYVNQQAYRRFSTELSVGEASFEEVELDVKGEGETLAYRLL